MSEWILFWKYLCGIGLLIYLVTLLIILPLGVRDMFRLLKTLRRRHPKITQLPDSNGE